MVLHGFSSIQLPHYFFTFVTELYTVFKVHVMPNNLKKNNTPFINGSLCQLIYDKKLCAFLAIFDTFQLYSVTKSHISEVDSVM